MFDHCKAYATIRTYSLMMRSTRTSQEDLSNSLLVDRYADVSVVDCLYSSRYLSFSEDLHHRSTVHWEYTKLYGNIDVSNDSKAG